MGLLSGALIGLLYAVGTGQSKAKYAAIGGAAGLALRTLYDLTPAGQRERAASQARLEQMRRDRALRDAQRYGLVSPTGQPVARGV